MLLIGLGVLLVAVGLLYTANQALWPGRLSERRRRAGGTDVTLEPRERGGGFGLGTIWPGLALAALGAALLLASAAL